MKKPSKAAQSKKATFTFEHGVERSFNLDFLESGKLETDYDNGRSRSGS